MKNCIKFFGVVVTLLLLLSCNGTPNHITNRYYLVSADAVEDTYLAYCLDDKEYSFVGVVEKTIFSVGFNDSYIIAKQHPAMSEKINYFIIPIYKEFTEFPEKGVIGPLNLEQFEIKTKELNISGITFTKTIQEIE